MEWSFSSPQGRPTSSKTSSQVAGNKQKPTATRAAHSTNESFRRQEKLVTSGMAVLFIHTIFVSQNSMRMFITHLLLARKMSENERKGKTRESSLTGGGGEVTTFGVLVANKLEGIGLILDLIRLERKTRSPSSES